MCDAKLILQPYDVKGYKGEKLLEREINLCTTTLHPLPEQYPAGHQAGKNNVKLQGGVDNMGPWVVHNQSTDCRAILGGLCGNSKNGLALKLITG